MGFYTQLPRISLFMAVLVFSKITVLALIDVPDSFLMLSQPKNMYFSLLLFSLLYLLFL